MVYVHNRVLFSLKEEQNSVMCKKMDGPRDQHIKWNEPGSEKQISHVLPNMWNPEKILKKVESIIR